MSDPSLNAIQMRMRYHLFVAFTQINFEQYAYVVRILIKFESAILVALITKYPNLQIANTCIDTGTRQQICSAQRLFAKKHGIQ